MLAFSDTDIIDEQRDESGLATTAPAAKSGSLPFSQKAAVTTRSRVMAMILADAPGTDHTVREQVIDPMVQRAATELVEMDDKGHKTDIKLQGRPYEVLEDIMGELGGIGASRFVTAQVLRALEEFSIHEGLNFSKQAKARPLYARIMVTSEKPDDLPDCEKFQYTFLDGVRRMGRDASNRGNLRPTIHGTQSSGSVVPGMDEMFEASKSKGLLLFFASVEGSDQNKFDDVDNNLMTLLQAFLGDTGATSIEEIEGMIRDGKLSPEAAELLKTLAEYQHLRIEATTPGAVDHAEERLAEMKSEIEALLEQDLGLPENVLDAIENRFEAVHALVEAALPELQEAAAELVQDNEAGAPDMEAAEELLSLIEMLSEKLETGELDELPPEIQQLLETIGDIETLIETQGREAAVAQISEVLAEPSIDSGLAKTVQTIVIALNDPAVQIALPQEALNQTNIFLKANADVVETVVRQVLIQDLKASLPDLEGEPEAAKLIEAVVDKLQEGQKLTAADVEVIAKVKEQVQGPVSETLAVALKVAQDSITPNVVLSTETLNKITDIKTDLTAVQEALVAMKADGQELAPEQQKLVDKIKEVVEVLDRDPANIQALQELSSLNKVLAAPENKALLPASVVAVVERVTQGVENVGAVHETALSIKHDVSVQNIRETVKLIETLVTSKEVLGAADIKIDKVIAELNKNIGSVSAAAELTKVQSAIDKAPPEVAKVLKAQLETVVAAQVESVSKTTGLTTETVRSTLQTITALESASPAVREALKQADVNVADVVTALKTDLGGVEGLKAVAKLEAAVAQMPAESKTALTQQLGGKIEALVSAQTERVAEKLGVPVQTVQNSVALVVAVEGNKEFAQILKAADIDVNKIAANPASTAALVESAKMQAVIDRAPPEVATVLKAQLQTVVAAQVEAVSQKTGLATEAVRSTMATVTALESATPAVREALKEANVNAADVVKALKNDLAGVDGLKAMMKLEAAVAQMPADAKTALSQQMGKNIETVVAAQADRVADKLGVPVQTVQSSVALVVAVEGNKEMSQMLKAANIDVAKIAANPASTAALVESAKIQAVIGKASPEVATVLKAQLQTVVAAQVEAVSQKTGLTAEAVRSTVATVTALESASPAVREALKQADVSVTEVVKALKNDLGGVEGLKAMAKLEAVVAGLPADAKAGFGKGLDKVVAEQVARVAEAQRVPVQTVQNSVALVVAVEGNKELAQILKAANIDVGKIAANPASTAALVESAKLQAVIDKAPPEVATVLKAQLQTVVAAQVEAVSQKTGLTTETVRSTLETITVLESASPAVREALKQADVSVTEVVKALKNDLGGVEGVKAMMKLETAVSGLPADAKAVLSQQFGNKIETVLANQIERVAKDLNVPAQTVQNSVTLALAVENSKPIAQMLKAAGVDVKNMAADPVAAVTALKNIPVVLERMPPDVAQVLKAQLVSAGLEKNLLKPNQSDNVIYMRQMFRTEFAHAGAEAEAARLKTVALLQRVGGANPSAPVVGAPANDVIKHAHGVFNKSSESGSNVINVVTKPAPSPYTPLSAPADPSNKMENVNRCPGCETGICATCTKNAVIVGLNEAVKGFGDRLPESAPAQVPTYTPPSAPADPSSKMENVNRCPGCETGICATCTKNAVIVGLNEAVKGFGDRLPESAPAQVPTYTPASAPADPSNKIETINRCPDCAGGSCGTCSKRDVMIGLNDAVKGFGEYVDIDVSARTLRGMSDAEIKNVGVCPGCTRNGECASCPTAAAVAGLNAALAMN